LPRGVSTPQRITVGQDIHAAILFLPGFPEAVGLMARLDLGPGIEGLLRPLAFRGQVPGAVFFEEKHGLAQTVGVKDKDCLPADLSAFGVDVPGPCVEGDFLFQGGEDFTPSCFLPSFAEDPEGLKKQFTGQGDRAGKDKTIHDSPQKLIIGEETADIKRRVGFRPEMRP